MGYGGGDVASGAAGTSSQVYHHQETAAVSERDEHINMLAKQLTKERGAPLLRRYFDGEKPMQPSILPWMRSKFLPPSYSPPSHVHAQHTPKRSQRHGSRKLAGSGKVIVWIQEVADNGFDYQDEDDGTWKRGSFEMETVVLSVSLFDRYLSLQAVQKVNLQLVRVLISSP